MTILTNVDIESIGELPQPIDADLKYIDKTFHFNNKDYIHSKKSFTLVGICSLDDAMERTRSEFLLS